MLHTSSDFHLEVETMNQRKKHIKFKKMIAAAAACLVLVTSATAAYAADVGGIQRTVQLWIHGDQTEATLHFDGNGNYIVKYPDSDGTITRSAVAALPSMETTASPDRGRAAG